MPLTPSNVPNSAGSLPDASELAAADWFIQHDRGLKTGQEEEFEQWLRMDERHAVIYAEIEKTWGRLRHLPAPFASSLVRPHRNWKQVWVPVMLAAAAAIAISCVVWWRPARPTTTPFSEFVSTDSVLRRIDLPDGSILELNVGTAVEVRFLPAERRVRLVRGEANFQVAKNAARPFVVRAGGVEVRAVGTAFNVRLRPEMVEVLVTEGKVRVDDAAKGESLLAPSTAGGIPVLAAGGCVRIPTATTVVTEALTPVQIEKALAWEKQNLKFDSEPLVDVVAEFNRYNQHKLVIADSRLAERRFGGTFPTGDYEAFVRLLEMNFGVIAERRGNETLLRLAP